MSDSGRRLGDQDLLARLNALKQSHIDLDDRKYKIPVSAQLGSGTSNSSAAQDLKSDLFSRFKSLNGSPSAISQIPDGSTMDGDESSALEEDSKTVEELLADLGPEESWNVSIDEESHINDLLTSAQAALKGIDTTSGSANKDEDHISAENAVSRTHELPNIDLEVYRPETSDIEDDSEPRKSKRELEADIDREAQDILARLKDEVQNPPPEHSAPDAPDDQEHADSPEQHPVGSGLELPSTPLKDPMCATSDSSIAHDTANDDLAARFASLSLPSVPTNFKSSSSATAPKPNVSSGPTDEEIESWCCICNDDATLSCIGCDGDLYCTGCWIEGHRSSDAGYEERTHKAIQYNKGGGVKKEKVKSRRVKVGA